MKTNSTNLSLLDRIKVFFVSARLQSQNSETINILARNMINVLSQTYNIEEQTAIVDKMQYYLIEKRESQIKETSEHLQRLKSDLSENQTKLTKYLLENPVE